MTDDEYLNVDVSASHGTPDGVAHILHSVAVRLEDAPEGKRYDLELSLNERERGDSDD